MKHFFKEPTAVSSPPQDEQESLPNPFGKLKLITDKVICKLIHSNLLLHCSRLNNQGKLLK